MKRAIVVLVSAAWAGAAQAASPYGYSNTTAPAANDSSTLVPNTAWVQNLLSSQYLALAGGAITGNLSIGGTLAVTGAATVPIINSASSAGTVAIKNGPGGANMVLLGGSAADIEPQTSLRLPGGTWGSGTLVNNVAPLFQNATIAGTTTNSSAAFGAFLQQVDTSSNTGVIGSGGSMGFLEHLTLNGAGVTGHRRAGLFKLDVASTTANTGFEAYVGLGAQCNFQATDGGGQSSCIALNPSAQISGAVTAVGAAGMEINTQIDQAANVLQRIGMHVVDILGSGSTYGGRGNQDDIAIAADNQYAPTSSLGFKTGLSFGRYGGNFPVATTGTLIGGQGVNGAAFTVANGIDWSLGTATGTWIALSNVFTVTGAGVVSASAYKTGATAGVTCSGAPTASFASASGIVTHC